MNGLNQHPNSGLVRCWSCNGTGIESPAAYNTSRKDIRCDRCKGTGKCPEIMRKWESIGRNIRKVRQDQDKTLREWADQLGVSVVTLSQVERGIADPDCLPNSDL